jgi:uncharacterized glyoxalase superfamily protein PhnB
MNDSTQISTPIWPTLVYDDAPGAIEFLADAFGFTISMVVKNEGDDSLIEHAQLRWPEGGGVMLGSANRPDNPFSQRPTGAASVYVVTADPDAVYDRAIGRGATVFSPLVEHDYGSRGFSVTDPEGNVWSFGTYGGEPE